MRRLDPVKHEEKRQEILAAAKACFARDGFLGISIADICQEAGISPGHLYHYFDSKDAILDVVFFFSSRRRHTRLQGDWRSDVCSSDLGRCARDARRDADARAARVAD